jgi:hypothetical protein
MSDRYKGAILSPTAPTVTPQSAGGIYTSSQQLQYQGQGVWPTAANNPLTNSLRFRASATAYLNRTGSTATNAKLATYSFWFKRGALTTGQWIFTGGASSAVTLIGFNGSSDAFSVLLTDVSGEGNITTALFRDPSAWYHFVIAIDTSQATTADRAKIYVNGVLQAVTVSNGGIGQNANWGFNTANTLNIGRYIGGSSYTDGYLAEVNFIDGVALTPSSFGTTDAYGIWQPIPYTGAYGTNGFYLPFTDNSALTTSSNVGLGKDFSGNGNYWTTNGISITAGSTYDSMKDVPTLTSATVANYAVMNPLNKASLVTVTDGNLTLSPSSASWNAISGTVAVTSGKWYYEYSASISSPLALCGWATTDEDVNTTYGSAVTKQWVMIFNSGNKYGNGANAVAYASAVSANTVVGVALDMDNGTLTFYIGGVSQGTAFSTGLTGKTLVPWISVNSGGGAFSSYVNFGQRPFTYTPPTGFLPLNTYNLPTPTILDGDQYFDATLYTGNGTSLTVTNSGSIQPDFVWIKQRNGTGYNMLFDSVRGVQKWLTSNDTLAETTGTDNLSAFNSNGFTVLDGGFVNPSSGSMVGWQWRASNAAGVSNTQGTITSTVSANTTAGFSILIYTGNGTAGATIGHGLGVAPNMIILKRRNGTSNWTVGHSSLPSWAYYLVLNITDAQGSNNVVWNSTAPTSTVFTVGTGADQNGSGNTIVAYCFAQVAGYSAMGSYTGNGSSDGTFVYTGFRPKFVMIKRTDSAGGWMISDTARYPYNVVNGALEAQSSSAEFNNDSFYQYDIVSNGIKIRGTSSAINSSGGTYIYACFAENPFKIARAR